MSQTLHRTKLQARGSRLKAVKIKTYRSGMVNGAVARVRTVDLVINSHTLYQLSYDGNVNPSKEGQILKRYDKGTSFFRRSIILTSLSNCSDTSCI